MAQRTPDPYALCPGDTVEIHPYPPGEAVAFPSLQGLDGSPAKVLALADYAGERVARVAVKSRDPMLAGVWRVPVKCLKILG